jgi:3-dehydroquinate synthase
LNFGHTIGHALESETRYKFFLHGEAVIHGMRAALYLSHVSAWLSAENLKSALNLLKLLEIPPIPIKITPDKILNAMRHDKKRTVQGQQWVLLQDIGEAFLTYGVAEQTVLQAIEFMLSEKV